jgi:hypothetical protein
MAMKDKPLGQIKQALGESYSYGVIRLVRSHRKYLAPGTLRKSLLPNPGMRWLPSLGSLDTDGE